MRKAGTVVRLAQGLLVLRSPTADVPDIGTEVLDENLDAVGRIVDVFGPVDSPYLAVTPTDDVHGPSLLNASLYLT